jgi:heterodisulfide reductase subunit B2
MKVSYYPGCALHGTAREYDESVRAVTRTLDVELYELPDWSCCGASSAHATDETLAFELASRNLAIARDQDMDADLVVPCAACYSRLKAAESKLDGDQPAAISKTRVRGILEFFFTSGLADVVAAKKTKSLAGLKLACYYGCLLVRPPKMTGARHHEYPEEMDKLMELLGAQAVPWSYKTDCCGGSLVLTKTDIVLELTRKLLDQAKRAGAEAIVVACPLCQSNLDSRQEEIIRKTGENYQLPILYFTELVGVALSLHDVRKWFKRHFVNPSGLLASKGLL